MEEFTMEVPDSVLVSMNEKVGESYIVQLMNYINSVNDKLSSKLEALDSNIEHMNNKIESG